jgi:hypothetical protein
MHGIALAELALPLEAFSKGSRAMAWMRILLLGVSVLVGAAASAEANPLTLHFSGSVDLSGSGGAADTPFSGFFTWETTKTPFDTEPPNAAFYALEAYQLILDGVDKTIGAGGAALTVGNDVDLLATAATADVLVLFAAIEQNAVTGDTLLIGILSGPSTVWNTLSLPTDYSFLSLLPDRFSLVSLEVPGGGDENDVLLGTGSFAVTAVPEPAGLTLTALALAGGVARARRGHQRRETFQ